MIFRFLFPAFIFFLSMFVSKALLAGTFNAEGDTLSRHFESDIKLSEIDDLILQAVPFKKERDYNQAIALYNEALSMAKYRKDPLRISLLHFYLGEAYFDIKNYTMAIAAFESCLKFEQRVYRPKLFAKGYFYLGAIYAEFNNPELSLKNYKQALNAYQEQKKDNEAIAVLDSIGGMYLRQGNKKEALQIYLSALRFEKPSLSNLRRAHLSTKVGDIYLYLKDEALALNHLQQALQLAAPTSDSSILNEIHSKLGLAYLSKGQYKQAESYFEKSMAVSMGMKDKKALAESYKNMAVVNEKLDRKAKEIRYFKKYVGLKDSLLTVENQKRIVEMRTEFEVQNKQKAIEILEHQKALLSSQAEMKDMAFRNNRILLVFFVSVFMLTLLFVFLLIRRHSLKRSTNLMLQNHLAEARQQKTQIEIQRDIIEKNNKKLEDARKIIVRKNKLLEENNLLLERTINERTLELYKAYQKLSFHVDNTSLAVMEFNDRLELIRWSDQAESIFGWTAAEVLGKRFHEIGFVLEKDIDDAIKSMHDLLYGDDTSISFLSINCNKYGDTLHIEWNTSVLLNKDGSVDSIMAIANNVSSREKAFEALQSSHRELDNFIYKASHDLRGPLARIQGVVNLGLMEVKEKPAKEYFNMLHITANQLNNILSRLLMIYDINHHVIKIEKINLKREFLYILNDLYEENKIENVHFNIKTEEALTWETDLLLFQIIIKNMFDNAIFFRDKKKTKVVLETKISYEGKLKITITDNGLGIPENVHDKVFDMFFHGAAKSGGTGLGLYMAKKAVERLGGVIQLVSGQPRNTIFEITFPVFSIASTSNNPTWTQTLPAKV